MEKKLFGECVAEFIGTALIIIFGCGAVAALVLTGANFGQWEISILWGMTVAIAIYTTAGVSGAHLNPAVTLALAVHKGFSKTKVIPFILSQVAGAFTGAALVYFMYGATFTNFEAAGNITRGTVESLATAGIFSTYPHAALTFFGAFMVEVFITALLLMGILALGDDGNGLPNGAMTALLIGVLISVIGASFGPLTGFAMNPARDFGPKLFTFIAGWGKIALTGGKDIPYFITPILAPIIGAQLGTIVYDKLIAKNLPVLK